MSTIQIKNVTKSFGKTCALKNVSLTFEEHKIYGLLGRNGAGKSTLLNIMSNRLFPTEGEALLDGASMLENDSAQKNVYLMSESKFYPEGMKIKNVLKWTKEFYPSFDTDNANDMVKKFGLDTNKKVKALSTGYTSIFKLIVALNVNVSFVFLDEPVLGLDANHRDLFYKLLIERYAEQETTYVISTHLIEEVANIIENVIIINKGEIMLAETKESFMNDACSFAGPAAAVDEFTKGMTIIGTESLGGLKVVYVRGSAPASIPDGITATVPDMQKMFINMTNTL